MLKLVRVEQDLPADEPIDRALYRARAASVVREVGPARLSVELAAAEEAGVELHVTAAPGPQPLLGRRVVVTRAAQQAQETVRALRRLGAEPLELPTIALAPPEDPEPLARAVVELGRFDAVALTSANAVDALFRAIDAAGADARALAGKLVAAVGPFTARALLRHGVRADLLAEEHRGEGVAEALLAARPRPTVVLLPRAAVARDALPEALREAGIEVSVVTAYRTIAPPPEAFARFRAALVSPGVDAVLFTASSTVQNLCEAIPDAPALLAGVALASIGPLTTAACQRAGLRVAVEASPSTVPAMLDALTRQFAAAGSPKSSS